MKKIAYYSDLLFCFFAVGVFCLCYFRYQNLPFFLALLLGCSFGASASLLLSFFLSRKQNAVLLKKREAEEAEKLALHLSLLQKQELIDFLKGVFPFTFYLKNGECFAKTQDKILLYKFSPTPLHAESVLPLLYESGACPAEVYCYAMSDEGAQFCARFGVTVVTIASLFQILQKENALPTVYKSERAFEKSKRHRLRLRFAKKGALRFFTSGVMLLFFSLLTPFSYYYLTFGGILVLCALFVRVFGTAN